MKKLGLIIIAILSFTFSKAQTTIITDDSTYTQNSTNAIMEIHSANGNKGILIPRLTTAQRTAISTSAVNDNSLLVYDTDTKTFWYFDGTAWVEIATGGTVTDDQLLTFSNDTLYIENGNSVDLSSLGNDWKLTGNSGTTVGTNFLGTTDNVSLSFKTNNTERLRILNTGNIGIGTSFPNAKLNINGDSGTEAFRVQVAGSSKLTVTSTGGVTIGAFNNTPPANGLYVSGNTGIGVSTPSEKLDVTGNIRASGVAYWGADGVRTEDRADAGASGTGIRSGFYQTSAPSPAADWPTGATGWWHLLDIRHNNTTNNYAMQFAGSFFDQKLYFRKTNNSGTTAWNEVTTAATETYTAVSLSSDIEITSSSFTDISGMSITFTAKKSTVLVTLNASGHGYTSSMSYVGLRVWNVTSGASLGGTSNKIQNYDDTEGTITVWNASYAKVITGLTPGATYTFKVQGFVDGITGVYNAVIYPATHPDQEQMTLTVFY